MWLSMPGVKNATDQVSDTHRCPDVFLASGTDVDESHLGAELGGHVLVHLITCVGEVLRQLEVIPATNAGHESQSQGAWQEAGQMFLEDDTSDSAAATA